MVGQVNEFMTENLMILQKQSYAGVRQLKYLRDSFNDQDDNVKKTVLELMIVLAKQN